MSNLIKTLKDGSDVIFPKTKVTAVYDESGNTLDTLLTAKQTEIDSAVGDLESALDTLLENENPDPLEGAFALINVTYPSGSICTCTCGDVVLTAVTTYGAYTFGVPTVGTWVVTIYDSEHSKVTKDVAISEKNQCEYVSMVYDKYIFKDGEELVELKKESVATTHTVGLWTIESRIFYFSCTGEANGIYVHTDYLDLSKYSTLHILAKKNNNNSNYMNLLVTTGAIVSGEYILGAAQINYSSSFDEYKVDISSVDSAIIGIATFTSSVTDFTQGAFTAMWLS